MGSRDCSAVWEDVLDFPPLLEFLISDKGRGVGKSTCIGMGGVSSALISFIILAKLGQVCLL